MKTLTPRMKVLSLIAAGALFVALSLMTRMTFTSAARGLLGLAALGGALWWFMRTRTRQTAFSLPRRVSVIQRIGLSQRSGLLLVEIDNQPFVILHGEGFATMKRTAKARRVVRQTSGSPSPQAEGIVS